MPATRSTLHVARTVGALARGNGHVALVKEEVHLPGVVGAAKKGQVRTPGSFGAAITTEVGGIRNKHNGSMHLLHTQILSIRGA